MTAITASAYTSRKAVAPVAPQVRRIMGSTSHSSTPASSSTTAAVTAMGAIFFLLSVLLRIVGFSFPDLLQPLAQGQQHA